MQADRQTDRQTDTHTDTLIALLHTPLGQSLIMIVLLGKEKAQSNKDKQHLQQHVKRSTKKTVRLH